MPVPVHITVLALEHLTCFVKASIVNSQVGEFTMPLAVPVPVRTVESTLECMEPTLLAKSLYQSV